MRICELTATYARVCRPLSSSRSNVCFSGRYCFTFFFRERALTPPVTDRECIYLYLHGLKSKILTGPLSLNPPLPHLSAHAYKKDKKIRNTFKKLEDKKCERVVNIN